MTGRCKHCGHRSTVHKPARPKQAAYCGSCLSRKAQHEYEEAEA